MLSKVDLLNNFCIKCPISIQDLLKKINSNPSYGIVFVLSSKNKLYGSIADGDIKRLVIKNKYLQTKVKYKSNIINKKMIELS